MTPMAQADQIAVSSLRQLFEGVPTMYTPPSGSKAPVPVSSVERTAFESGNVIASPSLSPTSDVCYKY